MYSIYRILLTKIIRIISNNFTKYAKNISIKVENHILIKNFKIIMIIITHLRWKKKKLNIIRKTMPNMLKLVLENQVKFLIIKIVLEIP